MLKKAPKQTFTERQRGRAGLPLCRRPGGQKPRTHKTLQEGHGWDWGWALGNRIGFWLWPLPQRLHWAALQLGAQGFRGLWGGDSGLPVLISNQGIQKYIFYSWFFYSHLSYSGNIHLPSKLTHGFLHLETNIFSWWRVVEAKPRLRFCLTDKSWICLRQGLLGALQALISVCLTLCFSLLIPCMLLFKIILAGKRFHFYRRRLCAYWTKALV